MLESAHLEAKNRSLDEKRGSKHLPPLLPEIMFQPSSYVSLRSADMKASTPALDVFFCLEEAARAGNLALVKELVETHSLQPTYDILNSAARSGRLELVEWLVEKHSLRPTYDILNSAARSGRLELVKWLVEKHSLQPTYDILNSAARSGNLALVQWLTVSQHLTSRSGTLAQAVRAGNLQLVSWLVDPRRGERRLIPEEYMLDEAVRSVNLPLLKYLIKVRLSAFLPYVLTKLSLPKGSPFSTFDSWKPAAKEKLKKWLLAKGVVVPDYHFPPQKKSPPRPAARVESIPPAMLFVGKGILTDSSIVLVLLAKFCLEGALVYWAKYTFFPVAAIIASLAAVYAYRQAAQAGFKNPGFNRAMVLETIGAVILMLVATLSIVGAAGVLVMPAAVIPGMVAGTVFLKAVNSHLNAVGGVGLVGAAISLSVLILGLVALLAMLMLGELFLGYIAMGLAGAGLLVGVYWVYKCGFGQGVEGALLGKQLNLSQSETQAPGSAPSLQPVVGAVAHVSAGSVKAPSALVGRSEAPFVAGTPGAFLIASQSSSAFFSDSGLVRENRMPSNSPSESSEHSQGQELLQAGNQVALSGSFGG